MIYCLAKFDDRVVVISAYQLVSEAEFIPILAPAPVEAKSWLDALAQFRRLDPTLPQEAPYAA